MADRRRRTPPGDRAVATLAVPILIAVSVHMLLALPDGRSPAGQEGRRGLAYAAAVALAWRW